MKDVKWSDIQDRASAMITDVVENITASEELRTVDWYKTPKPTSNPLSLDAAVILGTRPPQKALEWAGATSLLWWRELRKEGGPKNVAHKYGLTLKHELDQDTIWVCSVVHGYRGFFHQMPIASIWGDF